MQHQTISALLTNRILSLPLRLGFLILLVSLFAGCASHTPVYSRAPRPIYHEKHYSYRHSAPYNKPYRVRGKTYYPMRSAVGYRETGIASWYGSESGNRTAMGTRFRPQGLTAAHKTLPLPSKVRVTNLRNGRSVEVIVNDRGPFKRGRLIDLSHGAAKRIGLHGLTRVKIEYLGNLASNN
jgi:rare lipoprotein A